jgi:MFS family permease
MVEKFERRNIVTAYFLSLVSETFFPIAIWLFFYTQFLSFAEVALLSGLCGFAAIALEVPCGAFADIFGRKTAIVISYIFFSMSMLGVVFSNTFGAFLFFGLLGALSNALYSGSLEALVYDSLKENNETKLFESVISKMESLTWFGLLVGSVSGGFLYQLNFRLPYLVQAVVTAIAAVVALGLKEPRIDSQKYDVKQMLQQNVTGFKELFHNRSVVFTTLTFITISAGYYIASQILGISQAKEYGIAPSTVGVLFGVGYGLSAVAAHYFPQIRKKLGTRILLIASIVALLSSFVLAKFVGVVIGAALIIIRIASSTTFRNTRSITFNPLFSSRNRATAISTLTLLSNLPYVLLSYFIGDTIDKTSPNQFAFILGVVLIGIIGLLQLAKAFTRQRSYS